MHFLSRIFPKKLKDSFSEGTWHFKVLLNKELAGENYDFYNAVKEIKQQKPQVKFAILFSIFISYLLDFYGKFLLALGRQSKYIHCNRIVIDHDLFLKSNY